MKRTTNFNKILAVVLCLMMVASTFTVVPMTASAVKAPDTVEKWDGTSVSSWPLQGSGTAEDPYLISSGADYRAMVANDGEWYANLTYFKLTQDIDLNGFNPGCIGVVDSNGDGTNEYPALQVHFDGGAYTIYNMRLSESYADGYAMFNRLGGSSVIKDLWLSGLVVNRYALPDESGQVAGIAIETNGNVTIQNVHIDETSMIADANEQTNATFAAGFVGYVSSGSLTIKSCSNAAYVTSKLYKAAGFVAETRASTSSDQAIVSVTIADCINKGTIVGGTSVAGIMAAPNTGDLGLFAALTFTDCSNYGKIISTSTDATGTGVGGILGYTYYSQSYATRLSNCVNYGTIVSDTAPAGGIVGNFRTLLYTTRLNRCINYGQIESNASSIGGIVGYINYSKYTVQFWNCANYADLTNLSNASVGGLVGSMDKGSIHFDACVNEGDLSTSGANAGGFIGLINDLGYYPPAENQVVSPQGLTVTRSTNNGDITATTAASGTAAYIYMTADFTKSGGAWRVAYDKVVNTGTIAANSAGGVFGHFSIPYLDKSPRKSMITTATAEDPYAFTFINSVNTGWVKGKENSGGIAAAMEAEDYVNWHESYFKAKLESCYNIGKIDATNRAAGMLACYGFYYNDATNAPAHAGVDFVNCFAAYSQYNSGNNDGVFIGYNVGLHKNNSVTDCYYAATSNKNFPAATIYVGTPTALDSKDTVFTLGGADTTIKAEMQKINVATLGAEAPVVNISRESANLNVRLKMTAPFGFMFITDVQDSATGKDVEVYHNGLYTMKFAVLSALAAPADGYALKDNDKAVIMDTTAYIASDSGERTQCVEFAGLTATTMGEDLYFVCYLVDNFGGVVSMSEVRTINVYSLIAEAATSGTLMGQKVRNPFEADLYKKIVAYCDKFVEFEAAN